MLSWLLRGASSALRAPQAAVPPPALELAGLPAACAASDDDDEAAADDGGARAGVGAPAGAPAWAEAIWRAVPKRKPSYSVKRQRQMNPAQALDRELQHAYPCPKCDRGYIKLRHHLCPCDAVALNCKAVVKVRFGVRRRPRPQAAGEAAPPAAGAGADANAA